MTSDEIRQKAIQFVKDHVCCCCPDHLTAFAESLFSGQAAANREFDISVRCGHCNCVNYAVRSLAELEANERSATPPAASPQPAEFHSVPPKSSTYGDLPAELRDLIQPHEWDNMNFSEQRDWAIEKLAAASGSGTPATPSASAEEPKVINTPYGAMNRASDVEAVISAAVAAEREECAKLAEQSLDSAFCKGSFYGQQVAAAIRSRASQPAPANWVPHYPRLNEIIEEFQRLTRERKEQEKQDAGLRSGKGIQVLAEDGSDSGAADGRPDNDARVPDMAGEVNSLRQQLQAAQQERDRVNFVNSVALTADLSGLAQRETEGPAAKETKISNQKGGKTK